MKTIAVDFDGPAYTYSGYNEEELNGVPQKGLFNAINKLQERGFKVVILTARTPDEHTAIKAWFEKWAARLGQEFENVEITNVKPPAVAYIDDRAIRFTNWTDILNYF